ncbi:MAG: chromosome segregation protein SMC, partial [Thiolinea sp.]
MRLSKIRIAGFKSFVDPVTLDLRSHLVGILGPNGCGKSNTIDAVRWVMGESSAKHLRGQSMEDVIFNGSSARKPVGQASVELVFDNSDGQLGGEYAQYAEISVKRLVSRDGTSKYFLNGARCRRRDITDIFLGTGLGPRSYAIIEQGMISRLIEAKPEELRNTLEEAAGISRYKERRRETENRINHTRENLERLTDLRDELGKQLQKLDRQAKSALKFRELRNEERQLEALLLLLQEQALQAQAGELTERLRRKSQAYQDQLTAVRTLESTIEQLREQHSSAHDELNTVQGAFYQAGAEISRIEQAIQYRRETRERQQSNLQQVQQALDETLRHAEEDRHSLSHSRAQLAELEPRLELLQEQLSEAEERLFEAEEQLNDWQEQWQDVQQQIADPTRQAQVEKTRMEQLEQQLQHQQQRLERLEQEARNLSTSQFVSDAQALELELASVRERHQQAEHQLADIQEQLRNQQQQLQQQQGELNTARSRLQTVQGRLASLETLQQAGLERDDQARRRRLQQHELDQLPILAEQLDVESGWERALETVLAADLDALCLPQLQDRDWSVPMLQGLGISVLGLAMNGSGMDESFAAHRAATLPLPSLASKVHAPPAVHSWLTDIYCADTLVTALEWRTQLAAHQSLVTPEGFRVGYNWLRSPRRDDSEGSILQRQKDIQQLRSQQQSLEQQVSSLDEQCSTLRDSLRTLEEQRRNQQQAVNTLHREESAATGRLDSLQQRIDQLGKRRQQLESDQSEARQHREQLLEEHEQATERRNAALEQLETLQDRRDELALEKDERQQRRQQTQARLRDYQDDYHTLKLDLETHRQQQEHSRRQLERVSGRLEQLEQQRDELLEQLAQQDDPEELLQAELQQALEQRAE